MIKGIFKLNGKAIDVANTWDDFSWDQFNRIQNLKDDTTEMVSILTNVPRETLEKATLVGFEALFPIVHAIIKSGPPKEWDEAYVDHIGPYKLPKNKDGRFNIQFESLGQFEDMRAIMHTVVDAKGLTEAHPRLCAIYLQKVRDGAYDPEKAREMVEEVKAMPAKEVMVAGSFFYAKLISLWSGTPGSSPSTSPSPKKSKPVSPPSTKSSGRTRR